MRLFWLTVLTLLAFAANSVLTRSALALGQIGPGAFTAIRLASGAMALFALVAVRGETRRYLRRGTPGSAAALFVYAGAFSYSYVTLDTGIGALILFGGVQITMFAGALYLGERPGPARWLGTTMGMVGLAVLFAPGAKAPDVFGAFLMAASAVGWGIYSLRGRSISRPLATTAANFLLAAPAGVLLWLVFGTGVSLTVPGFALAVASGALASGMGYAIWYAVLPKLDSSLAAIAQLTVPLIALSGGIVFLGERATWSFAISSALILGGVAIAVLAKSNRR